VRREVRPPQLARGVFGRQPEALDHELEQALAARELVPVLDRVERAVEV
jgi:hypothetical protein